MEKAKILGVLSLVILFLAISAVSAQTLFFSPENDCTKCTVSSDCLKCINMKLVSFFEPSVSNTQTAQTDQTKSPAPIVDDATSRIESQIHELINQQRKANGMAELSVHPYLTNAARDHSKDMALNNYFSHESLSGKKFSDRIFLAGLKCSSSAENIFKIPLISESLIASEVVKGWMNSPGHRANILGYYTYEGIGVASSQDGYLYVTEDFC